MFLIIVNILTGRGRVRKEVPEFMMFADDILLCGGKEVDMTEYGYMENIATREGYGG